MLTKLTNTETDRSSVYYFDVIIFYVILFKVVYIKQLLAGRIQIINEIHRIALLYLPAYSSNTI